MKKLIKIIFIVFLTIRPCFSNEEKNQTLEALDNSKLELAAALVFLDITDLKTDPNEPRFSARRANIAHENKLEKPVAYALIRTYKGTNDSLKNKILTQKEIDKIAEAYMKEDIDIHHEPYEKQSKESGVNLRWSVYISKWIDFGGFRAKMVCESMDVTDDFKYYNGYLCVIIDDSFYTIIFPQINDAPEEFFIPDLFKFQITE